MQSKSLIGQYCLLDNNKKSILDINWSLKGWLVTFSDVLITEMPKKTPLSFLILILSGGFRRFNALCGYPIVKMEIRGLKVLKSKGLVFAQFCSKYDNSSSDWWKTVQILEEKYSRHIFVHNEAVFGKKPVPGACETSNSSHKQITSWQEKNLKIIFFTGVRNIVKMGSEIYKYLSSFFHSAKYLMLF